MNGTFKSPEAKILFVWFCLPGFCLLGILWVSNALSASATGSASVQIVGPLSFESRKQLNFGKIINRETDYEDDDDDGGSQGNQSGGGTVTITTQNQREVSGRVKARRRFSRAVFFVTGAPNLSYNIQLSETTAVHTRSSSPERGVTLLQVADLKSFSVNAGAETSRGMTNADGKDTIYIGGTLVVPPSAMSGRYRGDVEITLSY